MDDTYTRYTPAKRYAIKVMPLAEHDALVARILVDRDLISRIPPHITRDLKRELRQARDHALYELLELEDGWESTFDTHERQLAWMGLAGPEEVTSRSHGGRSKRRKRHTTRGTKGSEGGQKPPAKKSKAERRALTAQGSR